MNKKIILSFCLLFIGTLVFSCFASERNAFQGLMPKEVQGDSGSQGNSAQPNEVVDTSVLENLKLSGIFWGGDVRKVLIDGDIYEQEDVIKGTDAQIIKIEEGKLSVLYKQRVFILTPSGGLRK